MMTTRPTTQETQPTGQGRLAPFLMTVLTLALLGTIALWQVRQDSERAASSAPSTAGSRAGEGALTLGGLAGQHPETERARSSLRTDTSDTLDDALSTLTQTGRDAASGLTDAIGNVAGRSQAQTSAAQPEMGEGLAAWIAVQQQLAAQAGTDTMGGVVDPAAILAELAVVADASRLYIVTTAAEAEFLAGFPVASMGKPYQVLVLDPAKDDGQVLRGLGRMNEERSRQGLPPIEVVDLRPAPAAGTDAIPTSPAR